jgi:hypothetical protein
MVLKQRYVRERCRTALPVTLSAACITKACVPDRRRSNDLAARLSRRLLTKALSCASELRENSVPLPYYPSAFIFIFGRVATFAVRLFTANTWRNWRDDIEKRSSACRCSNRSSSAQHVASRSRKQCRRTLASSSMSAQPASLSSVRKQETAACSALMAR